MAGFPALARRSAGAAAALAVVLACLLPDWPRALPTIVLCSLVAFGAGLEISRLSHPAARRLRRISTAASTAVAAAGFAVFPGYGAFFLLLPGVAAALQMILEGEPAGSLRSVAGSAWMSMLWALGLGSIARLRAASPEPWLVLVPLACCWVGDSAAYFAGCAFGRHKLCPGISPAKSYEGLAAGLAGSTGIAVALGAAGGLGLSLAVTALAGFACGLAGVFGDLLESAFKRDAGVKDSGSFLPGHGGVLDRTDSLVTAVPSALLLFTLTGVIR